MQVKYNAKARKQISDTILYYLEEFGKQATFNLSRRIDEKVRLLSNHPGIGHPESLLNNQKILYRSIIIGRYHKIIYYTKGETLRIAAFWDMRMHPNKLKNDLT